MFEELENLVKELKEKNVRRVFIQIPEGLKTRVKEICEIFEKNKIEYLLSLEPTYGACDIKDEEAIRFSCEALIHIGHTNFGVKTKLSTYYVPVSYTHLTLPTSDLV